MYDKKTWVVVTLCSVAVALQLFYFNPKNPQLAQANAANMANAEQAKQEQFLKEAEDKKTATPAATEESAEAITTLETPEVSFHFTSKGGGIKNAALKNHLAVGTDSQPVIINEKGTLAIASILEAGASADKLNYVLEASVPEKSLTYKATTATGVTVKKSFIVSSDMKAPGAPYLLDCIITFENASPAEVNMGSYSLSLGSAAALTYKETDVQTTFFHQDGGSYEYFNAGKFADGRISKGPSEITHHVEKDELSGVSNQFFTTAVQPANPYATNITTKPIALGFSAKPDKKFHGITSSMTLPATVIPAGQSASFSFKLFTGPKDNTMMRKMNSSWGETMNYGWFSVVSRFLNFGLHNIHSLVAKVSNKWSWGFSIIILTLLVRTAIWPLYNKSTRSMKRMQKLKPEMDALRAKYSDDPSKMNVETMKLYKKYGVNPIGGCLPMLLQIPIFFGFYRMLQYAVELRHQPFLWVQDLSAPDTLFHVAGYPINPLPIVMTLSSMLQMHMMPATGDKAQQNMMKFMPLIFLFVCYDFASALALYWTVQNLFGIFQTWLGQKLPEPTLKEKEVPHKKSFMERMIERQQEMERMRASGGNPNTMKDVTPKKPKAPKTGG